MPSFDPAVHPWQNALTRRLRALIRTAPLHRVEVGRTRRSEAFSDQDLRALGLRLLDVVIEKMGLGTGATFEELRDDLRPLIMASARSLGADEADAVADTVVLALLNEPGRRQAFAEPYLQVTPDNATRKLLQFHLLREREVADGSTVIVATVEGINLYAGMLDYPVEDAQIADEAVLHAQVQRGRIHDAVQTARRARFRSIEYEQKVISLLETVRRDVSKVDWLGEVLQLLDSARTHVGERLDAEREIRLAVEQHLDTVADADAVQLVALRDTLDECIRRHARLHERLIGANRAYLAEHERQAFRPRAAARLPDLEGDVLPAAVVIATARFASLVNPLLARLQAPRPPPVLRVVALVDRLLAPRRNEAEGPYDLGIPELEALPDPPAHFSAEDAEAVSAFLAEAQLPMTLGDLIDVAGHAGLSSSAVHLVVLQVLRAFDPLAQNTDGLAVSEVGAGVRTNGWFGDDLMVHREAL